MDNIEEVHDLSPEEAQAEFTGELSELDRGIYYAKKYPRTIVNFQDEVRAQTKRRSTAQECFYALKSSGKIVTGPSVKLARIVATSYENLRVSTRIKPGDGRSVSVIGFAYDLQKNLYVATEVQRNLTSIDLKDNGYLRRTVSDDMRVSITQALSSIAFRDVVFKIIPPVYLDDLIDDIKQIARGTDEELVKDRNDAITYLVSRKVTEKQVLDLLEVPVVEAIGFDQYQLLRGIVTAIKTGEAILSDIFPVAKKKQHQADKVLSEATEKLAASLKKQAEQATGK